MQLTVKQAAELMQVDEAVLRRWIRDRGLPAVVFNEQYHLNRMDLLAWAQTQQIPVPAQAMPPAEAGRVSLHRALARGGIHRALPGNHGRDVLQALLRRLELPGGVDRELLLAMLLARQAQGCTGIGHGIVIPHARYPMVAATAAPVLALGFPAAPVELGAGEPVQALFLLLAPNIRAHLQVVARLARALTGPLLAAVQARADDAALLAAAAAGDAAADAVRTQPPANPPEAGDGA